MMLLWKQKNIERTLPALYLRSSSVSAKEIAHGVFREPTAEKAGFLPRIEASATASEKIFTKLQKEGELVSRSREPRIRKKVGRRERRDEGKEENRLRIRVRERAGARVCVSDESRSTDAR